MTKCSFLSIKTYLPAVDVVEYKIEFICSLEGIVKAHEERMSDIL